MANILKSIQAFFGSSGGRWTTRDPPEIRPCMEGVNVGVGVEIELNPKTTEPFSSSSQPSMSKSGNFPQDLIKEILILLPVRSFLRFKCVSKSFCSTIESQHFRSSRFQRFYGNERSGKLIELQKFGEYIRAFEFSNDFQRELVLVEPGSSRRWYSGYSYCKGLVLLHILHSEVSSQNSEFKFFLWNPSTGEYRVLPHLPLEGSNDSRFSFGLGYDSTTDDYKAVVFTPGPRWDSQVWIFTLRSNYWRQIRDGDSMYFPLDVFYGGNRGGFVDDALHFVCLREHEDMVESYIIVSFDVAKETFSEVEKPDCRPFWRGNIHLNVIGGCLAISFGYNCDDGDRVDLVDTYIRKKDGNEFNWTRLYNVTEDNFGEEVFRVFSRGKHAYSREGDKVLFSGNGQLLSYDYKKEHLQEIEVEMNSNHLDLLFCSESLVSLHPYGRLP